MTLIAIAQLLIGEARLTPGGPVDTETVAGTVEARIWGEAPAPVSAVDVAAVGEPVPATR
jgi:hypothetical protein